MRQRQSHPPPRSYIIYILHQGVGWRELSAVVLVGDHAPMDPLGAQLMEPRSAPIMEPFGDQAMEPFRDHLMEPG